MSRRRSSASSSPVGSNPPAATEQRASQALRQRMQSRRDNADVEQSLESVQRDAEQMGLFDDNFDPVRSMLASADSGTLTEQYLNEEADRLEEKSGEMQDVLSRHVLANYNHFVEGMNHVTTVMGSLRVATIIAKNGRRLLARADDDVNRALEVSNSQRQKAALLELLQCTLSLREVITLESHVREQLGNGEYVEAVCTYARAHESMRSSSLRSLHFASGLDENLQRSLWLIVQEVERLLFNVCADFANAFEYTHILQAYLVLGGEVKPLGDKVQELFLQLVEAKTYRVLIDFALSSEERGAVEAARKQHAAFGEIARQIPRAIFGDCFRCVLQSLQSLLGSHAAMLTWHKERESVGVSSQEGAAEDVLQQERNACADVVSGLERSKRSVWELAVMRVSSMLSLAPIPNCLPALKQDNPRPKDRPREADELGTSGLKVFTVLTKRLVRLGEAFMQSRANNLRSNLSKAEERLVGTSVDNALFTIHELFTTSMLWQSASEHAARRCVGRLRRVSASLSSDISLENHCHAHHHYRQGYQRDHSSNAFGRKDEADAAESDSVADEEKDSSHVDEYGDVSEQRVLDDDFEQLVSDSNYFAPLDAGEDADDSETSRTATSEDADASTNTSTILNSTSSAERDETGGVDTAVLSSCNAEALTLPSSQHKFTEGSIVIIEAASSSLELVHEAHSSEKCVDVAMRLPQEALEAGMVAVYKAFGSELEDSKEGSSSALSQSSNQQPSPSQSQQHQSQQQQQWSDEQPIGSFEEPNATPRLRKVMERLLVRTQQQAPQATNVVSSGNLFGLRETQSAANGLVVASQELKALRSLAQSRARLRSRRGNTTASIYDSENDKLESGETFEHWLTQTADTVYDLAEHLNAVAVRQLLPLQWLPDAIASNGKYGVQEVSDEPSGWVPQLRAEIERFEGSVKLASVGQEAEKAIWARAALRVANFEVEGFARSKRCTQGGRDQMLLDNQEVERVMRKNAPRGTEEELEKAQRRTQGYMQAFHESEDGLRKFVQVHPEYTYEQLQALVRQIAGSRGWSKKKHREFEQEVEEARGTL